MQVRREVHLGDVFSRDEFERRFESFAQLYNVPPLRIVCAPGAFARLCALYEPGTGPHAHSLRLQVRGILVRSGVLAPGTIAFEGEVDDVRMGDW